VPAFMENIFKRNRLRQGTESKPADGKFGHCQAINDNGLQVAFFDFLQSDWVKRIDKTVFFTVKMGFANDHVEIMDPRDGLLYVVHKSYELLAKLGFFVGFFL
jgi:hypothetical protein